MSEMVERVAIALFCADNINPHDPFEWKTSIINERGREMWRGLARVAIEAMREPTEDMKACPETHWGYSCHVCGGLTEGWHKMINTALGKVDA